MANSDKDILITPNTGSSTVSPKIEFVGANSTGSDTITMQTLYDGTKTTLSFEGSAGDLFSIVNDLTTNPIFSVNNASGVSCIEVDNDGGARLAEFSGNVGIGNSSPLQKLDVTGNIVASGILTASGGNSTNWNTAYGWGNHASQSYATQSYVGTQISNLVDSSPLALNTLNELAAALGDDENFSTTVTDSIATKLPLAGGTMTGDLKVSKSNAAIYLNDSSGSPTQQGMRIRAESIDTNLPNNEGIGIVFEEDPANGSPDTTPAVITTGEFYSQSNKKVWHEGTLTTTNKSNYDTAYGWGDHSTEGYLTSYTDTNTTYSAGTGITLTGTTFSLTDTNPKLNLSGGTLSGTLNIVTGDSSESVINLYGGSQGTGKLYVGQSTTHGGGIEYNGDGTPTSSGSGADYVTLFRRTGGVDSWTARNFHGDSDWKFRGSIYANESQRVFADNYHPNADKWTTPRSHTVTLTGGVTGTASQSVDGTGNRTWTIATTVAPISAPSAPSITATSVVGETIEITFSQSSTSNVDLYEVWSDGATGSDYSLIARVPEDDVAASMSIIDSSFDSGGTVAYRVYAIKEGVYSTAATATRAFTVPTNLDVTSLSVIADTNVYHINYNKPDSRFVDHIEIYKDVEATQASLSRTGASLIYSGDNSSFTYSIAASDLDNYHQFWAEVVTV